MEKRIIDIIIPAYNAHENIIDTLSSIAYQSASDSIKVTIVDDCSDKDYKSIIDIFKNDLDICELTLKKNSGPGVARQYGIDNTSLKYIMFMDSDDVLANPHVIEDILNNMDGDTDILVSDFYEETPDSLILREQNDVWLHGKLYKRSFIKKNKIRFLDTRSNEDTAFNQLCYLKSPNIVYINLITYIWRCNSKSITRSNDYEYTYKGVLGFLDATLQTLKYVQNNNYNEEYFKSFAYGTLISTYYDYLIYNKKYTGEQKAKIMSYLKEIKKYKEMYKYSKKMENELFKAYFNVYSEKYNIRDIMDPDFTFSDFLEKVDGEDYD